MSRSGGEGEEQAASTLSPQENDYKENQDIVSYMCLGPMQSRILGRTAKVCLAPLSLSDYKLHQLRCPRSLLEKTSSSTVEWKKAELKQTREKILTPKMKATASGAESTLQRLFLDVHAKRQELGPGRKSPSEAASLSVYLESSDEGSDEGSSDMDYFSGLSPYERKRLKNISENANFFASLQLSESAARLREMIKKRQPPESKRKKPKKRENGTGCRRSLRLLKVDPSGVPLPVAPEQPMLVLDENPLLPPGPLEMVPENQNDNPELLQGFLQTWAEMNKTRSKNTEKELSDIKSYKASLNDMVLSEATVHKVTGGSVSSVAIHPSESRTLVAVGSKAGQIGFWDLTQPRKEDGTLVFRPHCQPVSCLYFSPTNPAHILSLSYDGTVRCGDFSRAIFEEVYRNEGNSFSSFDFLTEEASTLLVGHWGGDMSLVDRRTPGASYEKLIKLSLAKIRTIHVHPVHRQYFIAAGLRDVHVYDVRRLTSGGSRPLIALTEHTKSLASAYFSPVTGNRVVTTCADCNLRVFDSSCMSSHLPLLTTIRHNTITGRWLTRFQAVWDPKQEDCLVVGSMAHPRRIEIFHETGKSVHSFLGDCLASVCSLNVMHPTQYVLAGGNSSGRVHVFMNSKRVSL